MSLLDQSAALDYLRYLTGQDDPVVCVQCFDDTSEKRPVLAWNRTGKISWLMAPLLTANTQRAGVFVTVNQTDGNGRKVENVTALRALFVDCDGTRDLPSEWPLRPSLIVQRGPRHWHAYWLLVDGEALDRFTPAQKQLATYWGTDLGVSDLPRVMRIPGFVHHKGEPTAVRLVDAYDQRYTIDQVLVAHPAAVVDRTKSAAAPVSRGTVPPRAGADDEMFRKWAAKVETSQGGAVGKGRDTSAFYIACEGVGRFRQGRISMATVHAVVFDYAQRAGLPNPEADTARVIQSAERKAHIVTDAGKDPVAPRERAASRPTTDERLQRAPSASEDRFGGGDDEPPAGKTAAAAPEPEGEPWAHLDLVGLQLRWALGINGVCPVELTADGTRIARVNRRVAGLPIWPERAGTDVASGATWWKLGWMTPYKTIEYQWLSEFELKQGHALVALPNGPVAKRHAENAAVYLTEARASVTQERAEVTSRIGWCGVNGGRRWVFPGVGQHSNVEYIGGELPHHGRLAGWKAGLEHLVKLPEDDGFTALAVVCLSAAAPWSRLMGSRNPIIGLMGPSSSGKGSTIDYALSMWADLDMMRLPASSTSKGIEDKAIQLPDLPIFVDELQQLGELHPQATGNVLYFLANGQRRTTSSKNQVAVGGERRYGVGFYAAEAPVLPGQNLGVLYRVIELDGRPCPDEATAKALQAGSQHTGTLAGPIAALLGDLPANDWCEHLRERAAVMRAAHQGLVGDDPEALALVEIGIEALGEICALTMPKGELLTWLVAKIRRQRSSVIDRETQCLHQVMGKVLNQNWFEEGLQPDDGPRKRSVINVQGSPMAWRTYTPQGGTKYLDIEPLHRDLMPLFAAHGGEERVLRHWADRGWIVRQEGRLRVKRAGGGRAVRFTNDAWIEINRGTVEPKEDPVS
jgi:hypothetical protein